MPEENVYEEEQTHGEEITVKEIREEKTDGEEKLTEEGESEAVIQNEAVQNDEHAEAAVQEEKPEDPFQGKEQEDIAEEIIYTEGVGMEEVGEQEYRTAQDSKLEPEFLEEEPKKRGLFRRNKEEAHFLRDKWILSRIRDEDLMDYLVLEQKRNEQLQRARDIREKRVISAFKLTVSLAAGVAVIYLLKDNPTIFVNILYIGGILGGFWFWKNSREK